VVEGKHYTKIGADYIKSLYSIINKEHEGVNFSISQQIIDLLLSESNYAETEQEGILKVIESRHSNIQKVHTTDSYVLVCDETGNTCFGFKSNIDCAKYFSVNKVSVGRWITKNSYISTKNLRPPPPNPPWGAWGGGPRGYFALKKEKNSIKVRPLLFISSSIGTKSPQGLPVRKIYAEPASNYFFYLFVVFFLSGNSL
jgi:hypothetical protein